MYCEIILEVRKMRYKAVFFDLDGTLLPMDQDIFVKHYFGLLAKKLAPFGYESEPLIKAIWTGTAAMVKNDGSRTNEEAFWDCFAKLYGADVRKDEPLFEEYYRVEFQAVQKVCGFDPMAREVIDFLKSNHVRLALATNPIFPSIATQSRIRWAGLNADDFEIITTYENSCYSKPNPDYYRHILAKMELQPEDCLMVGNDVTEDMVAGTLGMDTFLLTDCIINKEKRDISAYPHGGFPELMEYLHSKL